MHIKDTVERLAIHELGHALLAGRNGHRVNALLIDLNRVPKGGVWCERLDNHDYSADASGNREPARQDTRVLLAGQVAEHILIPEIAPAAAWSVYDNQQIDKLMIFTFATSAELRLFDSASDPRSVSWSKWQDIDREIATCRKQVEADIERSRTIFDELLPRLQEAGYRCWGDDFNTWISDCEGF